MTSLARTRFMPFALTLTVLIALQACQHNQAAERSSDLSAIRQSHVLRAGWAPYAPYSSLDAVTKQPQGFYIDLVEAMAKEGGVKVEWVETTWGTMISDLKTQKFQLMGSPVFRTIPRALEAAFTRPIDYFGYSAIVRKGDSRFVAIEDLNQQHIRIAVTQGEVGQEFAQRHLPKAELVVHKTGDIALALVDVIQGKADAGICDAWTAKQFAAQHKDTVTDLFAAHPFNVVGAGWFVAQDQGDLLQFLNTAIDWLESSGEIRRMAAKYELPSFLASDSNPPKRIDAEKTP